MAHKIQVKRGNKADLPTLDAGEFGLCQDTNELFIGNSGNQKIFPPTAPTISDVEGLQTALDGKVDNSRVLTDVPAGAKFTDTVYTHPATHSADMIVDGTTNKVFTSTEKTKLAGIAANANNYTHPGSGTNPHGTTKADVGLGNVDNVKQMPIAGGTFTGVAVAQTNTSYTTRQLRNVILSTSDPSGGSNGDIWIKYT